VHLSSCSKAPPQERTWGKGEIDVGAVELLIQVAQLAGVLYLDTGGAFHYASAPGQVSPQRNLKQTKKGNGGSSVVFCLLFFALAQFVWGGLYLL
jgi:hypothetical protein